MVQLPIDSWGRTTRFIGRAICENGGQFTTHIFVICASHGVEEKFEWLRKNSGPTRIKSIT